MVKLERAGKRKRKRKKGRGDIYRLKIFNSYINKLKWIDFFWILILNNKLWKKNRYLWENCNY